MGLLDDVVEFRLGEDIPHRGLLEHPADLAESVVGVEAQVENEGAGCVLTRLVRARRRLPVTLHDRHDSAAVRSRLEHPPDLVVAERLFEPGRRLGRLYIGRVRRTDVALRTHSRWPRAPSQLRDGRAPPTVRRAPAPARLAMARCPKEMQRWRSGLSSTVEWSVIVQKWTVTVIWMSGYFC